MTKGSRFDWWLFLLGLLLSLNGLVYIYSATWRAGDPPGPYFDLKFIAQAAFLVVALLMFFLLRRINWGLKPDSWLWFYVPVMLLLILVLLIGSDHDTGAMRWIDLVRAESRRISIQPSEFAKLGLTLILAWLYSGEHYEVKRRFWPALGIMLSMLVLVALQPDLGTSIVFLAIFFVMSLFAAVPRRWLAMIVVAMVLCAVPAWFMLRDYQKNRLLVFVGLEIQDGKLQRASTTGAGYHITQSENAIGSGGLTGQGFLRGTQTHGGFIPAVHTDFIFAVVGEEFGFIGCAWLLLLYFLLLARILAISREALSLYERYICYGASAVIFFHVFIAIGMTVHLAPVTGLPLPFVSYGGSALLTMWLYLAIIESIYANSRRDFRFASPRR